jgi:hypothetical protein
MTDGHNLLQGGGDWTNVIIPGDAQNAGFNHKKTYEVSSLKLDAEYECLVQARNQFGWSEASRIFHFYTGKRGEQQHKTTTKQSKAGKMSMTTACTELKMSFREG